MYTPLSSDTFPMGCQWTGINFKVLTNAIPLVATFEVVIRSKQRPKINDNLISYIFLLPPSSSLPSIRPITTAAAEHCQQIVEKFVSFIPWTQFRTVYYMFLSFSISTQPFFIPHIFFSAGSCIVVVFVLFL